MSITKNVLLTSYFSFKKNQKDSDDFSLKKLTWKVKLLPLLQFTKFGNFIRLQLILGQKPCLCRVLDHEIPLPKLIYSRLPSAPCTTGTMSTLCPWSATMPLSSCLSCFPRCIRTASRIGTRPFTVEKPLKIWIFSLHTFWLTSNFQRK